MKVYFGVLCNVKLGSGLSHSKSGMSR